MSTHHRPRVLAIAMQKGGVGKTTTAINLAVCFTELGQRVALLDLDPQANATDGLSVQVGRDDASMFEVLDDSSDVPVPLASALIQSKWGVWVGASHRALRRVERYGLGIGGYQRFARQVRELPVDLVIIDCPPNLGELTIAALTAADSVLATIKPGPDEIKGLIELQASVRETRDSLNPDVSIDFLVATQFDSRTILAKDVRRNLRNDWPDEYLGEVSLSVRVPEAKNAREPVVSYLPELTSSEDYRRIAQSINERMSAHVVLS
ncbi:ParA family protein [Mycobacterium kansasii]